jgi:hypothetical protein
LDAQSLGEKPWLLEAVIASNQQWILASTQSHRVALEGIASVIHQASFAAANLACTISDIGGATN